MMRSITRPSGRSRGHRTPSTGTARHRSEGRSTGSGRRTRPIRRRRTMSTPGAGHRRSARLRSGSGWVRQAPSSASRASARRRSRSTAAGAEVGTTMSPDSISASATARASPAAALMRSSWRSWAAAARMSAANEYPTIGTCPGSARSSRRSARPGVGVSGVSATVGLPTLALARRATQRSKVERAMTPTSLPSSSTSQTSPSTNWARTSTSAVGQTFGVSGDGSGIGGPCTRSMIQTIRSTPSS